MTKEKLFWPVVVIVVLVALVAVFDSEDEDEIAARYIPGYSSEGAARPGQTGQPQNMAGGNNVVINGQPVSPQAIAMLTDGRGGLPAGQYWYDARSGLWGMIGGPTRGQIRAGLGIGGPLAANASGGGTGIYFNGREIHSADAQYIRQVLGRAIPGRYWLNADLSGGLEGGPRLFSIAGPQGFNRKTAGGSILGDGKGCIGVMVPGRPGGPSTTVSSGC
jgi:hypothetical protein